MSKKLPVYYGALEVGRLAGVRARTAHRHYQDFGDEAIPAVAWLQAKDHDIALFDDRSVEHYKKWLEAKGYKPRPGTKRGPIQ